MADVATQIAPAPPHHNTLHQASYHDNLSDQQLQWLLHERQRHLVKTSKEDKQMEVANEEQDLTTMTVKETTAITEQHNNERSMNGNTSENTDLQNDTSDNADKSPEIAPSAPKSVRPKSGGMSRGRTRAHRVRARDGRLGETDSDAGSVSSLSSSSSSHDETFEPPASEYIPSSDDVAQNKQQQASSVRRASISSAEDQEEGAAFRAQSSKKTEEEDYDDYTITADQQKAMQELEKMKQEMDVIGDEEPPEYNVTELLKVLNKELAEDPMPGEERVRTIKFKENLVDVVAPPPEYSEDEDFEPSVDNKNGQTDYLGVEKLNISDKEKESSKMEDDNSEKVLIEREGKFELVRASEVEAMGLSLADIPSEDNSLQCEPNLGRHVPAPPNKPRPNTANGNSRQAEQDQQWRSRTRSQSASSPQNRSSQSYVSPYAISDEDKERQRKYYLWKRENDHQNKLKRNSDYLQKKQENQEAFEAWLNKKRQEAAQRRHENAQEENQKEAEARRLQQEREEKSAFMEWLQVKKQKQREDRQMARQRNAELEAGYYVRPREECDKAYKEWLQKKNEQARQAKQQARVQARYHRLLLRRSRKSQALAKAIRQSRTFQYVDVYGNRS